MEIAPFIMLDVFYVLNCPLTLNYLYSFNKDSLQMFTMGRQNIPVFSIAFLLFRMPGYEILQSCLCTSLLLKPRQPHICKQRQCGPTTTFWNSVWSSKVTRPEEHKHNRKMPSRLGNHKLSLGCLNFWVSFWDANY